MTTTANENARTALVHGCGSTLGQAVVTELLRRNVRVALYDPDASALSKTEAAARSVSGDIVRLGEGGDNGEESLVKEAVGALGGLDALLNVFFPQADTDPKALGDFPQSLLTRCFAAANAMAADGRHGAIVTHTFLPAMYAGTRFDAYMPAMKGAITGVTRTLCREFGKAGIRVNCVQTGLVDMPETQAVASAVVQKVKVPVGRWATPTEVAKLMTFLVLDNGYVSGQCIIMDGGLTAGITGT